MLGLPPSVKIHFATTLVDMRKGIDGLRVVVDQTLKKDPLSGHLFVFVGKSRDKAKILFWDRNGFVLYLKRLGRADSSSPSSTSGANTSRWSRRSWPCSWAAST